MSKIKLIRCKTPHDIIVVRNRRDRDLIYELARSESLCGHKHLIVSGDLYFRTPGYAKAEISDAAQTRSTMDDFYPAELPCPLCKSPSSVGRYGSRDVYHCTACKADITGIAWKYLPHQ